MLYRYFLFISMTLYAIGFSWLVYIGEYHLSDPKVSKHLLALLLFLCGFALAGLLYSFVPLSRNKYSAELRISPELSGKLHKFINILGVLSCLMSIFYLVDGGFEKFALLGSNIDPLDFRHIGLNDRSKWIAIPMELSRRMLLPFAILGKFSLNRFAEHRGNKLMFLMLSVFFVVSIVNLDRGPILMFIVMITFQILFVLKNLFLKLLVSLLSVVVIGFSGAYFSFLQYNRLDFTFADLLGTLEGVLLNRIILSPVKMSQTYVFDNWSQFTEPLFMEYSRIGVLWGNPYVGSRDVVSYLIAPVGSIGEVYRNLGIEAMLPVGFALGIIFMFLQRRFLTYPRILKLPISFVSLILVMYLHYGNMFSLGPFSVLVFIFIAPIIFAYFIKNRPSSLYVIA